MRCGGFGVSSSGLLPGDVRAVGEADSGLSS